MLNKHKLSRLTLGLILSGALVSYSSVSLASAFQLWEQNGAGVGDYHAGGAAEANDASTGFYNAAGLTRIKNQQIVGGLTNIVTNIHFKGEVEHQSGMLPGSAQGGGANWVPNLHFAMPINDRLYFGAGITVPFGLKTDYSDDSIVSPVATETQIMTINFSPSLAYKINENFSIGGGPDIQYMKGVFDDALIFSDPTQYDENNISNWAYGWHFGVLYQFTKSTRVGFSYRSAVIHHAEDGDSKIYDNNGNKIASRDDAEVDVRIPATSTLSFYHDINNKLAVLGTVNYTQWTIFNNLILQNASTPDGNASTLIIPQHFKNTWNFALGMHYKIERNLLVKAGVGFDQTPTNNKDRNLRLPDSNRLALATGLHYQAKKDLGLDIGWTHIFRRGTPIHNDTPFPGGIPLRADGTTRSSAEIIGFQLTWDI